MLEHAVKEWVQLSSLWASLKLLLLFPNQIAWETVQIKYIVISFCLLQPNLRIFILNLVLFVGQKHRLFIHLIIATFGAVLGRRCSKVFENLHMGFQLEVSSLLFRLWKSFYHIRIYVLSLNHWLIFLNCLIIYTFNKFQLINAVGTLKMRD